MTYHDHPRRWLGALKGAPPALRASQSRLHRVVHMFTLPPLTKTFVPNTGGRFRHKPDLADTAGCQNGLWRKLPPR